MKAIEAAAEVEIAITKGKDAYKNLSKTFKEEES